MKLELEDLVSALRLLQVKECGHQGDLYEVAYTGDREEAQPCEMD